MLTLTDTAAEAVRQLSDASGLEPDPGLRISPGDVTAAGTPLNVEITGRPHADDRTVDENGAHVYVEPTVADFLDDKLLDASVESGQVRFAIVDAPAGEPPPSE